jgi:ribonuclease HII
MTEYILGIDEVGRGCLAGPITVAAVAAPVNSKFEIRNSKLKLKDSKKLSADQRQIWFDYVKKHPKIFYAKASVYPKTIDRINISQAANLAATRAFSKLISNFQFSIFKTKIFLDGGLYLNSKFLNAKTVIKADEKYNVVKLASIVAKVGRDRVMKRNHKKFPHYGFDQHVGYGTRKHISAIKRYGICDLHRLTFVKNFC